ncbi:MAG: CpsB/CapC family capsule biosynthesis tyrosine phosphatase [Tepidisphaeraceae bacterium]|jgi:protein-tyrosine phosphatase
METGRIDVHSHLLPGLDDGCADAAESLACAKALVAEGYTHAFCTPHVWRSLSNNPLSIAAAVANLQAHLDSENIALKLMPGGEINLLEAWPQIAELQDEQIVTYGMAGKYLLFDFWADTWAECREDLEAAIGNLVSRGLKPIMGHPERIAAMREPGAIERVRELGALLQLNSYCLSERVDKPLYEAASRWLTEDKYFLIGSDTHKPAGMGYRSRGLKKAGEIGGEKMMEKLTVLNPRLLME